MVIQKIIGYASAIAGLAGILFSSEKTKAKIVFLNAIPGKYLLIAGLIFVGIGVFFLIVSGKSGKAKQKQKEVPIYKGKEIIGYRVG